MIIIILLDILVIIQTIRTMFETVTIKLNSMTFLEDKSPNYFRILQSNLYHKNRRNKHIYSYSFSLNPEEFQPSGAINFSDLNTSLFTFNFTDNVNNTIVDSGCATNGVFLNIM